MSTLTLALVMMVLVGLLAAVVVDLATTVRRLQRDLDDLGRAVDRDRRVHDRLYRDRGAR